MGAKKIYGLLTDKQEAFAKAYIEHFNKSKAARDTGSPEGTAGQIGDEMYKLPHVKARIEELLMERRQKYEITEVRMQEEIGRIAFSDIIAIYDGMTDEQLASDITVGQLRKLPEAVRACIKKVSPSKFGLSLEFYDKPEALTMLAKHFGYFEADNKQKVQEGIGIYLPDNGRGDFKSAADAKDEGN